MSLLSKCVRQPSALPAFTRAFVMCQSKTHPSPIVAGQERKGKVLVVCEVTDGCNRYSGLEPMHKLRSCWPLRQWFQIAERCRNLLNHHAIWSRGDLDLMRSPLTWLHTISLKPGFPSHHPCSAPRLRAIRSWSCRSHYHIPLDWSRMQALRMNCTYKLQWSTHTDLCIRY